MAPRPINLSTSSEPSLPRCPDCNSVKLTFDSTRGEVSCGHCGVVVEESYIDQSAEWRAYSKEQHVKRARTGTPKNLLTYDQYGTLIDYSNKDIFGNSLSPEKASQMFRLRTLQRRAVLQYGTERNLLRALNEIKRISSQLNLTLKVRETAAMIYRKILKTGLVRGRSTEALVSAALYLSCRLHRQPASLQDIADKTRLDKKKLAKNFRLLLKHLDLKMPLASPESSIAKFASILNFSPKVLNDAQSILTRAKSAKITVGKNPNSLAAAALYIAALQNKTKCPQNEIAKTCQITEVTLRNRYKEFIRVLKLKVNML
ncbi:MAG: transcription initiation factor IIB [Candidatus Heimdallarchaeota archaeon]|nr:transcription initiation factor IIB [Candidatus Heimdallarchaeota archaeon]MCK4954755.1 transcription initiation factor IIB [Candidatus Heimdallarchaeota archaeon]